MTLKTRIYLADLTHKGHVLSSSVFPLSIGLIGAYLLERRPQQYDVHLFKYTEDFSAALEKQKPDLVAFANYSWNFHLAFAYTRIIKSLWPDVPVVFGGPIYGVEEEETHVFWTTSRLLDFSIVREGKEAFLQLLDSLQAHGMSASRITAAKLKLPHSHYTEARR